MNETKPPSASIRRFSGSRSGLWSSVSTTAFPPLHSTPRESPTCATVSVSSCTTATMAVVPSRSPSRPAMLRNSVSVWWKACLSAFTMSSFLNAAEFTKRSHITSVANRAARSPPCPSYTAKKLQPPGMRSRAKHRSSCDGRRPWIDDEPNHDDERPAACATLLARIGVKPMAERGAGTAR